MVIIFISSRRAVLRRFAALCIASQCNSTICLLLLASALLGALLLSASQHTSPQFNSTICLLQRNELRSSPPLDASRQRAPQGVAPQLNSTQRFVCYIASRLCSPCRNAVRLNSTQRFVCYSAASRYASLRSLGPRNASHRYSTQRFIGLFITAPQRHAAHGIASLRNSTN